MTEPLGVLLKVKSLKEESALKEANAKRAALAQARAASAAARARVRESASTLGQREDAVYGAILGQVVNVDAIDDAKARVVEIEKAHEALVDLQDRAVHVEARRQAELNEAVAQHKKSVRDRDKYILLVDDATTQAEMTALAKEEGEAEESFGAASRRLQ